MHFVVLLPPFGLLRERDRSDAWQRGGRLEALYQRFERWEGVAVIDPGDLAPDLVADRVMALAAEGGVLLSDQQA